MKIDEWRDPKDIGAAVRAILERGPEKIADDLKWARDTVQRTLTQIDDSIAKMRASDATQKQEHT